MMGLMFISYASWVVNSGIALYAMFVGLLIPSLKKHRKVLYLAVAGAIINSLFYASQIISTGWAIVLSTLVSAVIVEMFYIKYANEENQHG
jgi:predicted branched-subunit amino acid permease